jgi:8-amino-7-oxononanoate synthase
MTELPHSRWSGAAPGSWLGRWLSACADLEDLFAHHHLLDATIEEIDGRRIRVGERWLIDFASCNYLGLDLDREVIEAIPAYLDRWGTHPSWSRMLGNPALYPEIETRLTELLGAADSLLLPTLTHIHASVIPVLASDGTIFVDSRAHKTIWDGCVSARAHGATVVRYAHDDPQALERLMRRHPKAPRLVCMDGINSMTGNPPDLPAFLALARANDALLYVDDAHGFGVVGERGREEISPFGRRGNGVVRHLGESYDHIVLTGGFSKAYSSLLAFVACPTPMKRLLKIAAPPYLYSGPSPVASLASTLLGLQVNAGRGDELRAMLYGKTRRVLDHLEKLGAFTLNRSGFPIIEVPLAEADELDQVGRLLFERGIYATLAFYPGVPRHEVGFRLQLTAAHTGDQVDELLVVLDELADRGLPRTSALG